MQKRFFPHFLCKEKSLWFLVKTEDGKMFYGFWNNIFLLMKKLFTKPKKREHYLQRSSLCNKKFI